MIHNSLFNKLHRVFFYLLIVLIPTQLGLHFWPSWAMVLGRRVDYLSPTLYLTDILIVFMLLCWIIDLLPRITNYELRITRKTIIYNLLFIIPFIYIIANIYFAASWQVAIYAWIKFFEFFLLGLYIVKTKPKFDRIVFFLSLSVIYSSGIAITQFFLQHSIGGIFWFLGERTFSATTPGIAQIPLCLPRAVSCPLLLRAYGTFSHPNVLGGYIAVVMPLIIFNKTKKIPIFKMITIILGLLALILTFSRSAWVAGVLGVGIWYLVSGNSHLASWYKIHIQTIKPRMLFPVLFFVLFIASITVPQFLGDSESVVVRAQLNASAISLIRQSPFFGVGAGNFLGQLPEVLPSRMIYFLQPVHNIYLLLLSEIGFVGSIILGWLLFTTIKDHKEKFSIQNTMIRISLFMILLLGFTDHYAFTLQQGQLLFTLLFALVLQ